MSRGFVKEDDQEEVPRVPQRAYLPEGVPNYVTREGLDELIREKEELISERDAIDNPNENEKRIARNFINARLNLLKARIADARLVDNSGKQSVEVTFGAIVSLRNKGTDKTQVLRIVGVDEADITKGKLSFISPLAKALMNKKVGDSVSLKREREDLVFEVTGITYK